MTNKPAEEKMTATEIKKNLIVQFEFHEIKRVYAAQMAMGKATIVAGDEKEFKVFIKGAEVEGLKKFCEVIEKVMSERRKEREEREKRVDDEY